MKNTLLTRDWIIVTGASDGIGLALTAALAKEGRSILMACRNMQKAKPLQENLSQQYPTSSIELVPLDLSSWASIRRFAEQMKKENRQIATLVNNAGVMLGEYQLTEDGFEQNMAVNYLGHFLLTMALLPCFKIGGQVINTSSMTHKIGRIDNAFFETKAANFNRFKTYSASKLAIDLFSLELSVRHPQLRVYATDPGVVSTKILEINRWIDPLANLLLRPFIKTPLQGAASTLYIIRHPEAETVSLGYWENTKLRKFSDKVNRHPLRTWLWEESLRRINLTQ